MSWWTRKTPSVTTEPEDERKLKTEGLWEKCDGCGQIIWKRELEENLSVCTQCGFHCKLNAEERLNLLFDDGQWQELDATL
ncbi:MAG: acetyl-CoA carboxylase carboxyl transferase subunit beta, partial [Acidobacteriaceae bacterium]|nr:acetyl-CoA carboxylase carboxyl transferase subunit beta [Acidobacteriaceae bacterium]